MKLTLLTLTGDRPWAFAQCEQYMKQQTVGWNEWLVVDDGKVPITPTLNQKYLKIDSDLTGRESFRRNMAMALNITNVGMKDKVLFIEDDDWYSRFHIETLTTLLDTRSLVGQGRAKYYNVAQRKWMIHPNTKHASLCQTGFKGTDVKAIALSYLATSNTPEQLDGHMWTRANVVDAVKWLLPASTTTVGLKAVPGRGGLGCHHTKLPDTYKDDADLTMLKLWLGSDAELYAPFYEAPNANND